MTDRTRCLTVVLDNDYRTDDVEAITDAIFMIKGVIKVDANISDWQMHTAIQDAKRNLMNKLYEVLK